ncbi:MAG: LamG domain-containing protein [Bacteroidaceae bacterium]|nr:LamG domain-containing protein [Bacteroidaceae bacterium]
MKKTFTFILVLTLCMLGTSVKTFAEVVPAPAGRWTFDDVSNLLKCDEGSLTIQPAIIPGNKQVQEVATVADANILTADGPLEDNKAILVPKASSLKVVRASGAAATRNYSIMIDFKVESNAGYNSFYQTSETNNNDGDFFLDKGGVGINAMGGYGGNIESNKWYRLIIVNEGDMLKGYVNAKNVISLTKDWATRWEIDPYGFYLFCDEDGEDNDIYVAEVAFWEQALSAEQIIAYGNIKTNEFLDIAGDGFAKLFNEDFFTITVNANSEITFTCPDWIIPIDVTPFNG